MSRLIEKAVAVLGGVALLIGTSILPASAAGQMPFTAHVTTVPTLSSIPYVLSGSGASNVLGPFTQTGSIQPVGAPVSGCAGGFSVVHHDTYTVANGDTL